MAQWSDLDMFEAWRAGFQWCADRVEIVDDELFVPTDEPGVTGRDHADECGHWLNEYEPLDLSRPSIVKCPSCNTDRWTGYGPCSTCGHIP